MLTNCAKQTNELKAELWKRAKNLRYKNRRNNILDWCASLMAIDNEKWDTNRWLLGVTNGVLDLRANNFTFRHGKPEDYMRTVTPTEWKGLHHDQLMDWFVPSLFDDRPPHEKAEIVNFLHKQLGYGITGETSEENFVVLWGAKGRNGKDTLLKFVEQTLGNGIAGPIANKVIMDANKSREGNAANSHVMALRGKRLVWASETKKGEILSAAGMKHLTGGGTITARELYQKQQVFEPTHTLMLMTNFKPHLDATDDAAWARLQLIEFRLRFLADPQRPNERKRDTRLKSDLSEERKSQILAWLVNGCLKWQREGLLAPDALLSSKEAYRREEDTIGRFIEENCELDPSYQVPARSLYNRWKEWAQETGHGKMSSTFFGTEVSKRYEKKHTMHGRIYSGLRLL